MEKGGVGQSPQFRLFFWVIKLVVGAFLPPFYFPHPKPQLPKGVPLDCWEGGSTGKTSGLQKKKMIESFKTHQNALEKYILFIRYFIVCLPPPTADFIFIDRS